MSIHSIPHIHIYIYTHDGTHPLPSGNLTKLLNMTIDIVDFPIFFYAGSFQFVM